MCACVCVSVRVFVHMCVHSDFLSACQVGQWWNFYTPHHHHGLKNTFSLPCNLEGSQRPAQRRGGVGQWRGGGADRSSKPLGRLLIPVGPLPPPVTPLSRVRGPGEKLRALACSFPALCELVLSALSISLAKFPLQLLSCVWGMLFLRGISHFRLRPNSTWNMGAAESCQGLQGAAEGC